MLAGKLKLKRISSTPRTGIIKPKELTREEKLALLRFNPVLEASILDAISGKPSQNEAFKIERIL